MLPLKTVDSAESRRQTCPVLVCCSSIPSYKSKGPPVGIASVLQSLKHKALLLVPSWSPCIPLWTIRCLIQMVLFPVSSCLHFKIKEARALSAMYFPYLDLGNSWITQAANLDVRCLPLSSREFSLWGRVCKSILQSLPVYTPQRHTPLLVCVPPHIDHLLSHWVSQQIQLTSEFTLSRAHIQILKPISKFLYCRIILFLL